MIIRVISQEKTIIIIKTQFLSSQMQISLKRSAKVLALRFPVIYLAFASTCCGERPKMVVVKLVLLYLVIDLVVQEEVETLQIACRQELHGNDSPLGLEY